jgi:hypothetical protein
MNAHRIPRTGLARARGEHLQAANEPFQPEDDEDEPIPCPICNGEGSVWVIQFSSHIPCANCDGHGALDSFGNSLKDSE